MVNDSLQQKLEVRSGMKLKLTINNNRSTMLSVRWEPRRSARVSLHRMFLRAPRNVMDALACYIRGDHKVVAPSVKAFIEHNLRGFDYSNEVNRSKLITQGTVYNLQQIKQEINDQYFSRPLKLTITWFGSHQTKNKSRMTFGLYYDPLKLIKINRLLDSPSVPRYVIAYVIYHEMLHNVCPAYVDEKGITHVHSKEFKEREAKFHHFSAAQTWLKENQERFFATLD